MISAIPSVVDVTDATFEPNVIEESFRRPVVVDFWAEWCQPCQLMGIFLERTATEAEGRFLLARVDVESNTQLAETHGVQAIPALKVFRSGEVVAELLGAIPESALRDFISGYAGWEAPGKGG